MMDPLILLWDLILNFMHVYKMDSKHIHEYNIKKLGHMVKLAPPIENEATGGNICPPLEVAGYIPIIIDNVKYKIPLFYD